MFIKLAPVCSSTIKLLPNYFYFFPLLSWCLELMVRIKGLLRLLQWLCWFTTTNVITLQMHDNAENACGNSSIYCSQEGECIYLLFWKKKLWLTHPFHRKRTITSLLFLLLCTVAIFFLVYAKWKWIDKLTRKISNVTCRNKPEFCYKYKCLQKCLSVNVYKTN